MVAHLGNFLIRTFEENTLANICKKLIYTLNKAFLKQFKCFNSFTVYTSQQWMKLRKGCPLSKAPAEVCRKPLKVKSVALPGRENVCTALNEEVCPQIATPLHAPG